MSQTPIHPEEHVQFDQITARLGDWEHLPAIVASPIPPLEADEDREQQTEPLDELILAGLVSPY